MASVRLAGLCLVTASLVVSAPVLVFSGLVLDYFYHARSFVIVTSWSWVTGAVHRPLTSFRQIFC